jgi:hypothetical protein
MLSLSSPLSLGFSAPTLAPASRAAVRMQEGGFQDATAVAAAAEKAAGQVRPRQLRRLPIEPAPTTRSRARALRTVRSLAFAPTLPNATPRRARPRAPPPNSPDPSPLRSQGEFCYGLPGNIAPVENFDPFNLLEGKTFEQVRTWREAELAHCRVGMLAATGFLVQEKFHPLFSGDGGPAIQQIPNLPPFMWFAMTLGIGVVEGYRVNVGWSSPNEPNHVFQKLRADYVPGDLGFDPLGLKPEDPAEFAEMQTKELQNGRLAMLAAAGFMAQEAVSGDTWGAYWGVPDF